VSDPVATIGYLYIYSKRRRRELGQMPDIVQYEVLPKEFRVQVHYVLNDALGNKEQWKQSERVRDVYRSIVDILLREYGQLSLLGGSGWDTYEELRIFLQNCSTEQAFDVIEIGFRAADLVARKDSYIVPGMSRHQEVDEAIDELNARFKEHAIGYQFESGEIIRTDSKLLHQEAVRPALQLLSDPTFQGAEEEFVIWAELIPVGHPHSRVSRSGRTSWRTGRARLVALDRHAHPLVLRFHKRRKNSCAGHPPPPTLRCAVDPVSPASRPAGPVCGPAPEIRSPD
jgi:hypothetical protein